MDGAMAAVPIGILGDRARSAATEAAVPIGILGDRVRSAAIEAATAMVDAIARNNRPGHALAEETPLENDGYPSGAEEAVAREDPERMHAQLHRGYLVARVEAARLSDADGPETGESLALSDVSSDFSNHEERESIGSADLFAELSIGPDAAETDLTAAEIDLTADELAATGMFDDGPDMTGMTDVEPDMTGMADDEADMTGMADDEADMTGTADDEPDMTGMADEADMTGMADEADMTGMAADEADMTGTAADDEAGHVGGDTPSPRKRRRRTPVEALTMPAVLTNTPASWNPEAPGWPSSFSSPPPEWDPLPAPGEERSLLPPPLSPMPTMWNRAVPLTSTMPSAFTAGGAGCAGCAGGAGCAGSAGGAGCAGCAGGAGGTGSETDEMADSADSPASVVEKEEASINTWNDWILEYRRARTEDVPGPEEIEEMYGDAAFDTETRDYERLCEHVLVETGFGDEAAIAARFDNARNKKEYVAIIDALAAEHPETIRRLKAEFFALEEIRIEQRRTGLIINRGAFGRVANELLETRGHAVRPRDLATNSEISFEPEALKALQVAAEDYLIERFSMSNRVAIHAGRTFVGPEDIQLVRWLLKESG